MSQIERISDQVASRQADLLALNNVHQKETSYLSDDDWRHLVSEAYDATCIGTQGFLITFDPSADYDSPNFIWFQKTYSEFVYVDRIVVAATARGQGIARQLYEHLFDVVKRNGIERVVCEVNLDPPNPVSDAFHAQLGFSEVGRAELKDRSKTVRYLCKSL